MKSKPALHIDATNLSNLYSLIIGYNGDKYMCTSVGNGFAEFRRVRMPKSKIDSVRLPESISITFFGSNAVNKKSIK